MKNIIVLFLMLMFAFGATSYAEDIGGDRAIIDKPAMEVPITQSAQTDDKSVSTFAGPGTSNSSKAAVQDKDGNTVPISLDELKMGKDAFIPSQK